MLHLATTSRDLVQTSQTSRVRDDLHGYVCQSFSASFAFQGRFRALSFPPFHLRNVHFCVAVLPSLGVWTKQNRVREETPSFTSVNLRFIHSGQVIRELFFCLNFGYSQFTPTDFVLQPQETG